MTLATYCQMTGTDYRTVLSAVRAAKLPSLNGDRRSGYEYVEMEIAKAVRRFALVKGQQIYRKYTDNAAILSKAAREADAIIKGGMHGCD